MVEERVSRLEGAYEQVSERLGDLTEAVGRVDAKVEELRVETNARFEAMRAETNARFESLRAETNAQFEAMRAETTVRFEGLRAETNAGFDGLRTEADRFQRSMESRFNAVFGLLAATWATLAAGIIAVVVTD